MQKSQFIIDTVKSLSYIKKETIFMIQVISELKQHILGIKDENAKIAEKIGDLEKRFLNLVF